MPAESNVEVAVAPKYAFWNTESWEVEARTNVARPVCVSVPLVVNEPNAAVCAKRFVLDAVVEKRFVVVALPKLTSPDEVRLAAVKVVPSNVKLALSVNAPAVVM